MLRTLFYVHFKYMYNYVCRPEHERQQSSYTRRKKNGNLLHFFIFGYKRDLDTI